MGKPLVKYPSQDGDEFAPSPATLSPALLGTERGTDSTRRVELDDERNVYVHVAKDSSSAGIGSQVLNNGTVANVTATTLTTIVSYTALVDKGVTRISCSGTDYAKFSLVLNTVTIEYQRSGPSRNIEFGPLKLSATDVLDVKVEHFITGDTANFESTIYGV